jgi:predicted transglutaminase-like cysteine proteinase
MTLRLPSIVGMTLAGALSVVSADARGRLMQLSGLSAPITTGSPALAPLQHVRFCLRYPPDCKSEPTENERIDLTAATRELLERINHSANISIIPTPKRYGPNLEDRWTIAPEMGDCNDYAVTKRHELVKSGLPARALRLAVVRTASGIGHLVLVAVTTKGDLVMDDLTETIRPWQSTNYYWLKIQSAADAKLWYEIKRPMTVKPSISRADQTVSLRIDNRARSDPTTLEGNGE